MEEKLFKENFQDCMVKNWGRFSQYFDLQYNVFFNLRTIVFELTKCQIFELHSASITLTNHLLERLLKEALIKNNVGIESIPFEDWNSVFNEANKKFGSKVLGNTLDLCKKYKLINPEEYNYLISVVKDTIRNGFSHAEAVKILEDFPEEVVVYVAKISSPTDLTPIHLKQKVIPSIQAIQIDNFAKEISTSYFKYVIDLVFKIENRLLERKQSGIYQANK